MAKPRAVTFMGRRWASNDYVVLSCTDLYTLHANLFNQLRHDPRVRLDGAPAKPPAISPKCTVRSYTDPHTARHAWCQERQNAQKCVKLSDAFFAFLSSQWR